jgi:cell filamentation protein
MPDPYLIPGTNVLRNKLNIVDADELNAAEYEFAELATAKLVLLDKSFPCTLHAWRTVHHLLFDRIYDWAGELRTIFITKRNDRGLGKFSAPDNIARDAAVGFTALAATLRHIPNAPLDRILVGMADAYVLLNQVHPFREGNGRSQKVLFARLARQSGIILDWDRIDPEEHIEAAIDASYGDPTLMRQHFLSMGEYLR